jgi:hypothetical protein
MKGSDYVAKQRISNKVDDTLADVGDRCDRVPVEALPWLLDGGHIEAAPAGAAAAKGSRKKGKA